MDNGFRTTAPSPYVVALGDVSLRDVGTVGGKNASLGELIRSLEASGVRVARGFATTVDAYKAFIAANGLESTIRDEIGRWTSGAAPLAAAGQRIRTAISSGRWPAQIAAEIEAAYTALGAPESAPIDVAVRSSATAEDLPDASFAGQQ